MLIVPGLSEVCEQLCEDVLRELDVGRRHAEVFSPDVGEDILKFVAVNDPHVDLKSIKIRLG